MYSLCQHAVYNLSTSWATGAVHHSTPQNRHATLVPSALFKHTGRTRAGSSPALLHWPDGSTPAQLCLALATIACWQSQMPACTIAIGGLAGCLAVWLSGWLSVWLAVWLAASLAASLACRCTGGPAPVQSQSRVLRPTAGCLQAPQHCQTVPAAHNPAGLRVCRYAVNPHPFFALWGLPAGLSATLPGTPTLSNSCGRTRDSRETLKRDCEFVHVRTGRVGDCWMTTTVLRLMLLQLPL
jgi:hypothetical protein